MKKSLKTFFSFLLLFLIALACTKDVGLITEVEFQLLEEHTQDGYINQGIPTTFTILPEAEMDGFEYDISYEILQGSGYYEDVDGNPWDTGKGLPLTIPLTTSLQYMGSETGEHRLRIVATDNFGFSEELEIGYNLKNVPARWEATSEMSNIELGKSVELTLLLQIINATLDLSYEARFEFATGSGTILPLQDGGYPINGDYAAIAPGTYPFVFTPSELGTQQIIFVLKDSNGQEIKEELVFNVVEVIKVISIFLGEDDTIEMQLGDEIAPDITFDPTNATDQGITLVSSDPEIVFIDENNVCIAVGLGTAVVTVTSTSNPEAMDTVTVTVVEADRIPVTSIRISQADPNATGAERLLIAEVTPEDATDRSVIWSTNDETIATISQDGLLTGLNAGSVTIMATSVSDPGVNDTITVEITGGTGQNENNITAFELPNQNGSDLDPSTHTITVNVTEGTELDVSPSALSISAGATIVPGIDQVHDFNYPVEYTVTAGDGVEQVWTVNVTISPLTGSDQNDITTFELPAQNDTDIDDVNHSITVNVPDGTVLNDIVPSVFNVSAGATVTPSISVAQDFNTAVEYTVTSQDNTPQTWTINTTVAANLPPIARDEVIDATALGDGDLWVIDVMNNDTDTDTPHSELTITGISALSQSGYGSLVISGRHVQFTSNASATEPVQITFSYTINDGNPGNDATATVTILLDVVEKLVTGVTLNPTDLTLEVGQDQTIITDIDPSNATDTSLNWTSDNEAVATVSSTGVVNAIGPGQAVITAATNDASNISATVAVTVNSAANSAPVAQNDTFTIPANGNLNRDVFVDNGNGPDDDADLNDVIFVERVKDNPDNVGIAVTGSLGGSFTINSNGDFNFSPNNDFDDLNVNDSRNTEITYRISDGTASSNTATVVVIVTGVGVLDTTPPEILLSGAAVTLTVGEAFVDPGYTASDNVDGDITGNVIIGGGLNINVANTYTVTYNVMDAALNPAIEKTRTVVVEVAPDTTPPVILLTGGLVRLAQGEAFVDPGYTASDNVDGDITGNVIVGGGLNTNVANTYTVTYNVMDAALNPAIEKTRTVVVEAAPDFTFSAFPEGSELFSNGNAIPIGFIITPNAAAQAEGITFEMRYVDTTNTLTEFDYGVGNYLPNEDFVVQSGNSQGSWGGPIDGCYIGITFTVTNNIGIPSKVVTVHLSPAHFLEPCN